MAAKSLIVRVLSAKKAYMKEEMQRLTLTATLLPVHDAIPRQVIDSLSSKCEESCLYD